LKAKMLAELKQWPKDPVELAGDLAEATAAGAAAGAPEDQQTLSKMADKATAKETLNNT
jgi:hypothetical protein